MFWHFLRLTQLPAMLLLMRPDVAARQTTEQAGVALTWAWGSTEDDRETCLALADISDARQLL